ncbi:hypothetical protein L6R50_23360 [Myxococcota bacterium]|nr:hypothetical protein [Myxococcota bacterium]
MSGRGIRASLACTAILLAACLDRPPDTSGQDDDDDETVDDDTADDDTTPDDDTGLTFRGVVRSLPGGDPFGDPSATLFVTVADPTPLLTGSIPEVLAVADVDGGTGAFEVPNVPTEGMSLGLALMVDDLGVDYHTTGIILSPSVWSGAGDGSVIDVDAYVLSAAAAGDVEAGLDAAGWTGASLAWAGAVMGFVRDADGLPLAGATVTPPGSAAVYYADGDLFTASPDLGFVGSGGSAANAATTQGGRAVFVVPSAPIGFYAADGPGVSFPNLTGGTLPGMFFVTVFEP